MRSFNAPPLFTILSADEARRVTGLDATQLRALPSVQMLKRTLPDGRREDCFRLPTELLTPAEAD
ncbi:MAG: hypothetical protein ABR583_01045 [Gaiellaceae bacterium]